MDNTKRDELDQFVDILVKERGMDSFDSDVLLQVKKDLKDRLENRINAVILEHIPPDKLEIFEKMLESDEKQEIQDFCQSNIPDLEQVIANEMVSFKKTYLNL